MFTIALNRSGAVFQWGRDWGGEIGGLSADHWDRPCKDLVDDCHPLPVAVRDGQGAVTDATAVAAGSRHGLVVRGLDHTVWSWGINRSAALGYESYGAFYTPAPSHSPTARAVNKSPDDVVAVQAGLQFSLALRSGPPAIAAWAWGDEVGLGTELPPDELGILPGSRMQPAVVSGLPGNLIGLAAGASHVLAVSADSTVWGWGDNRRGAVGGRPAGPDLVIQPSAVLEFRQGQGYRPLSGVSSVAAGCDHSLALTKAGKILSWGSGSRGQRGDDITWDGATRGYSVSEVHEMKAFGEGAAVQAVAAGCYFSLALLEDGTVWAWGDDSYGQLGFDTDEMCTFFGEHGQSTSVACSRTPHKIPGLSNVERISAGASHAIAVARS